MRFGTGPVLAYERLTASRRWQYYALRSSGAAAILVAMGLVAHSHHAFFGGRRSLEAYAELGESYFNAMIAVELTLVMLAAPAATAGAICLDRSRGSLEHLMATDLSDAEIVLGKLAARLMPVLGLVAACLPVLALSTLLGGIDALSLAVAFAVIATVALLACTLALALSVWARRPYEVILAVYTCWTIAIFAHPFWKGWSRAHQWLEPPDWLLFANPFYPAIAFYNRPGVGDVWLQLGFFAVALGLAALLASLAIRNIRPAAIGRPRPAKSSDGPGWLTRIMHRLPGPSLDGNPVLWREWRRARSPRLSAMLALLVAATIVACAAKAIEIRNIGVEFQSALGSAEGSVHDYLATALFGGLVLAAIAPMSLSEERRRGSLDVLMTTPLPTKAIVLGKWLSLYRTVPWLALGPGLLGFGLAVSPPLIRRGEPSIALGDRLYVAILLIATLLAGGAAIVSVGLALATWLRRETRAIGTSITAFVLVSGVWPSLCLILTERSLSRGDYVPIGAALSPIFATTTLVGQLCRPDEFWHPKVVEVAACTCGVAVASLLILGATIATFDRQMGRAPEGGWRRHKDPAAPAVAGRAG